MFVFSIGITNEALFDIFHWYLCHDNISIDILILRKQNLKWYCFKLQLVSYYDNLFNLDVYFQLVYLKIDFQNWYPLKPSWKLRGEFHWGEFCLVKGKAFETGGEISNLENASCNLIHIPLTICKKKTLKRYSKRFAKTKQVVQMWSKILNKRKQSNHI
jgi:hypothetical protein